MERLQPCLDGLTQQGPELREILVVDSRSQDGTPELVQAAQAKEPRLRLMTDDPLPPGWVGRVSVVLSYVEHEKLRVCEVAARWLNAQHLE